MFHLTNTQIKNNIIYRLGISLKMYKNKNSYEWMQRIRAHIIYN